MKDKLHKCSEEFLKDKCHSVYTILQEAFEAGFNSALDNKDTLYTLDQIMHLTYNMWQNNETIYNPEQLDFYVKEQLKLI